jgi:hypothetical protein
MIIYSSILPVIIVLSLWARRAHTCPEDEGDYGPLLEEPFGGNISLSHLEKRGYFLNGQGPKRRWPDAKMPYCFQANEPNANQLRQWLGEAWVCTNTIPSYLENTILIFAIRVFGSMQDFPGSLYDSMKEVSPYKAFSYAVYQH